MTEHNYWRDHHPRCFSIWMAGGGIKGGYTHGATDEFGHKAVQDIVTHHDYHATLLHLFGLSDQQVSFPRPTGRGSLIDGQSGKVVTAILRSDTRTQSA